VFVEEYGPSGAPVARNSNLNAVGMFVQSLGLVSQIIASPIKPCVTSVGGVMLVGTAGNPCAYEDTNGLGPVMLEALTAHWSADPALTVGVIV
jgi:hypothetical protein